MRIAVDCEFNGFGGELISMALVAEDGREWYRVLPLPEKVDEWVAANVVPLLWCDAPVSREEFRLSLGVFLDQFDEPVIVADWYTDLMHFFESFEGESHLSSMHIPCKAELLPNMEYQPSEHPHHALSDARAIMRTLKCNLAFGSA